MHINGKTLDETENLLMNQIRMLCNDDVLSDSEKLNNLVLRNSELTKIVQTYLELQRIKLEDEKIIIADRASF
ncbi:MAG: hypothetical protein IJ158_04045 [Treponema sp.]|nr:hypothetical protein [Treponema sp.]